MLSVCCINFSTPDQPASQPASQAGRQAGGAHPRAPSEEPHFIVSPHSRISTLRGSWMAEISYPNSYISILEIANFQPSGEYSTTLRRKRRQLQSGVSCDKSVVATVLSEFSISSFLKRVKNSPKGFCPLITGSGKSLV